MYIIHNIPTPKKEYTVCCPQARRENKKSGCPHIKTSNRPSHRDFLELMTGIEPVTSSLPRMCATICATSACPSYSFIKSAFLCIYHILTKDVRYHLCHISKRRLVL